MSDRPLTPAAWTRRAIQASESGNLPDARQMLAEALRSDPNYETAWLWYAHLAENDAERKFCLQRAAAIREDSPAAEALGRLANVQPDAPGPLADIIDPEAPPPLTAVDETRRRRVAPAWLILGALALLALLGSLAWWQLGSRAPEGRPMYIALASGLSGPGAAVGEEVRKSVQLELDRVNAEGGIDGHPVELVTFDDENNPEKARGIAEQIAADDRILAVIGHRTSASSLAAGPVYAAKGIPAVTSSANANAVTDTNPWYFRTVFDNARQGTMIAAGVEDLLAVDKLILVSGTDVYGTNLSKSVAMAFTGEVVARIDITDEDSIPDVVSAVKTANSTAPIVLAMQNALGKPLIVALRDAGVANRFIAGDSFGSDAFLASFSDLDAERTDPGHYTDGMVAVAPLFMDSLSADALRWSQRYENAYGSQPSWFGATAADATLAILEAMQSAGADPDLSPAETRLAIRTALAGLNDPDTATPGVLGPIWFDQTRSTPRNIAIGVARDQLYSSAPVQFSAWRPSGDTTVEQDLASGAAIDFDGVLLQRQRIVFTGLNVNEVSELDLGSQTFEADFFVWFRYDGDDSATDIEFLNATDPALGLGDVVRETKSGGQTYRLYRVKSTFKAQMDFHGFPFDTQNLPIQIQNRTLPSSKLVYALDRGVREQPQEERLRSGVDASASIANIPNWLPIALNFYQQAIGSTAALGDPEAIVSQQGIEYSVLTTDLGIRRDVESFLIKNLLPLALLVIVTYVSLFFSHSQTGARVSFGITGILTTAVLLTEVTSSLPDIGYNVAIEWAFYAFIGLCAICILVGLVGDYFYEKREFGHLRKLDVVARILYPAIVLAVVAAYWVRFRV